MKVRAAVLREIGRPAPYAESRPLGIEDVELDPPGEGEVLVRIRAAGLCHSDLSVIDGNRPRPMPMVLGHEAAGVVEAGRHPASRDSRAATTSWRRSCRAAATACPARPGGRRCASPASRRIRRARCSPASAACTTPAASCTTTSASRASRSTRCSPPTRWCASRPTCRLPRRRCSAARSSPASARWSTPPPMPRGASAAVVGLGGVGLAALLAARMLDAEHLVADRHERAQAGRRARARRDRHRQRRQSGRGRADPRDHRRRRRLRVRDGGLGARARTRLQDHRARRHDGRARACRTRSSSSACST